MENLENVYKKGGQLFYQRANQVLENEKRFEILDNIQKKVDNFTELNTEEFELLGSYCYMFGIDFVSSLYFNKELQERLNERLYKHTNDLDGAVITQLLTICKNIKESQIVAAKDEMVNKINQKTDLSRDESIKHIMTPYRRLFESSIIDIKYAVECVDLSNTTEPTYQDILKINNSVNENFKYVGYRAINNFRDLFYSKVFMDTLRKSAKIYDDVKFGLVYFDSILSMQEKMSQYDDLTEVVEFVCGAYNEEDYNKCKENFEHKQTNQKLDDTIEEPKYQKYRSLLSDEESQKVMQDNPMLFLLYFSEDNYTHQLENIDFSYDRLKGFNNKNFMQGFDIIMSDIEIIKDFYGWLKAQKNFVKPEHNTDEFESIDVVKLFETVKNKLTEVNEVYKKQAEDICQNIPKDDLSKIKVMFDEVISGLVLDTTQQKQYIISNFFENQVATYQNLVQLLQLVESCEIKGDYAKYYKKLNEYVGELPFNFDITEEIDKSYNKSSMLTALKEFIEHYINVTSNGTKNN